MRFQVQNTDLVLRSIAGAAQSRCGCRRKDLLRFTQKGQLPLQFAHGRRELRGLGEF
jgi:hypothetical protein